MANTHHIKNNGRKNSQQSKIRDISPHNSQKECSDKEKSAIYGRGPCKGTLIERTAILHSIGVPWIKVKSMKKGSLRL